MIPKENTTLEEKLNELARLLAHQAAKEYFEEGLKRTRRG